MTLQFRSLVMVLIDRRLFGHDGTRRTEDKIRGIQILEPLSKTGYIPISNSNVIPPSRRVVRRKII